MRRVVLLVVLAAFVAAVRYLPWWASLGLLVATPVLGWFLAKRALVGLVMGAFKAKSAVLAGARAQIRSILPAPPFKPEGDEEGDVLSDGMEEPHHWVYIDLDVIAPEHPDTPMQLWDPSELAIVGENADPDDRDSDEQVGQIHGVERMEQGAWVQVEEKLCGSHRLRLHVAARDGVDRFRIRYYFELLKNAA